MSVWLPTAPCTPGACATPRWPAAGRLTAVARLIAGMAAVLAGVVLSPLAIPLSPAGRARLASLWSRTVIRAFGVRIRIVGEIPAPTPPRRLGPVRDVASRPGKAVGTLVVANHISWLDIPLVAAVLPGRMLAKREVRQWPVLGPLAGFGGTLFLDRDRLRALPGVVRAMADALGGGARVIVFPEGSTWCGRGHGRFRNAAFQAALDAGAVVQPVRITYRPTGAAAFVGEDPLTASLWRVVTAGGLTAEITLLPAIPAARHPDRRSLARAAQTAVVHTAAAPGAVHNAVGHTAAAAGAVHNAVVHTAVDSDSANLPSPSVHHSESLSPASASSVRTPS
ncbi:lysophospholipid acyltransferase family protein [Streptomyces sp. NPDC000410]|uniref:lysophospholipid acyltransferase family protein n=1 Tax=Streptomyces sp. NPDC000410 TaxID=3154254 RepID=UPI003318C3E8